MLGCKRRTDDGVGDSLPTKRLRISALAKSCRHIADEPCYCATLICCYSSMPQYNRDHSAAGTALSFTAMLPEGHPHA